MKHFNISISFLLLFITTSVFSQVSYNTYVASIMNQVNTDSVYKFERQLCGDTSCIIGGSPYTILSRHWNSTHNPKAAQYIFEKLQSFGLTTWYQNITSTNINVLAKKVGTKFPNQYVIICGHYDDMPSGTTAPGADDNASGTVCVLEAARLLKNINLPYTVVFAAWDEEERGLYGSIAYADTAYARGDSIIAVLNFDMIAYDGNNDGQLDVNTNSASLPLANEYAQIVSLYQPTLIPQVTTSLNGGSDHQSFQNKGYKAILAIEDNSDFTPYYHTVNDTYSSLNKPYFIKMVKAAIAALVTIAGDYKITISHTPVATGPSTASRTAIATIKSSYKIATGSNQPRLYYSVNNGAYSYVTPSYSNLDTVKFTIPGQSNGATVKYYIAAQDSGGTLISTLPAGGSGVNPPGTTAPPTQFSYQVANVTIVTIGNGTSTSNYPYTTYWHDGRTQMLYLANEINSDQATVSGNITKIGFNVSNFSSQIMNGFTVKMQNTTATMLSGWVSTGWTTCYSGSYSVPGTGWQYIDMQTPLQYNGTSNLLIEICYDNTTFTDYSPVFATSNAGKTWGYSNDNLVGCSITSGSTQSVRPNIALYVAGSLGIGNETPVIPRKFDLKQNYPNPFNPVTRIQYEIPKASFVTLKVYDILGREAASLVNANMEAGYYTYDFDASSFSSGVYIYKLTCIGKESFEKTLRMIVLK